MALPAGIATTTITFGTAVAMISTRNLGMTVKFTPTTSLVWAATGTVLIADAEGFTADPGTQGSVTLINPDQAGFSDGNGNTIRNWGYKVEATYTDGGTTLLTAPTKYITWAASDAGPIDLDQMIPVTASSGITVSMPLVTSVNGQTGDVVTAGTLTADHIDLVASGTHWLMTNVGDAVETKQATGSWITRLQSDGQFLHRGAFSSYGYTGYGRPGSRTPWNSDMIIDGSTLGAANLSNKVGMQNSVLFQGGFAGEAGYGAPDPGFLFGANDFIRIGTTAGDMAGVSTVMARLTELHVDTPGANIDTATALELDIGLGASATGATVNVLRGLYITAPNNFASGVTVNESYGLAVASPTVGTKKYAIYTSGTAPSVFNGDLQLSADPSAPGVLNAYSGTIQALTGFFGPPTEVTTAARLNARSASGGQIVSWFQGRGGQSGDLTRWGLDTFVLARVDHGGRLVLNNSLGQNEVADAELNTGDLSFWVDPTTGAMKLNIKAKDNGGTIRRAQIALT